MISEYDKVHNERTKRIIISEYAEKLGLENDKYIVDPYRTLCFTIYAENPLPARICIEDLPRRFLHVLAYLNQYTIFMIYIKEYLQKIKKKN